MDPVLCELLHLFTGSRGVEMIGEEREEAEKGRQERKRSDVGEEV